MRKSSKPITKGRSFGTATLATLALLGGSACGVDDRALQSGAPSTGDPNGIAGVGAADTGAGGAADETPTLPVCDYSGGQLAPGCETIARNPGFDTNARGWSAENSAVVADWNEVDALGASHSGSLSVVSNLYGETPGMATMAARQCEPASPQTLYGFACDAFVASGQGAGSVEDSTEIVSTYEGRAGLTIYFYDSADCSGRSTTSPSTQFTEVMDEWVHLSGLAVSPQRTQSMSIRLNLLKPYQQFKFGASFDNVLVIQP